MIINNVAELKSAVRAANVDGWQTTKKVASGWLIDKYRPLRTAQERAKAFYEMTYEVDIHSEFKKIKLPTARKMVSTMVSHLPLFNPIVEVVPALAKAPYIERAAKQMDFLKATLDYMAQQIDPFIVDAATDLGARGEAFTKVSFDTDSFDGMTKEDNETDEDFADRRREYLLDRFPIKITALEPMNCYPVSNSHIDGRPAEMVEIFFVTAGEIRQHYPDWESKKKNHETVAYVEYWNEKKICFLAGGIPVLKDEDGNAGFVDNPYKIVPYNHVYSGYGHRNAENKPESKAVSIIFDAFDIIMQKCRWNGYLDKAVAFAAMPIVEAEGEREDYTEPIKPAPGAVYYGAVEGRKVRVIYAAPKLPDGILQAIQLNDAEINTVQPAVLRGEAPQGVESGYPMAIMVGQARLEFGLPLQNMKTLVARTLETVRYLIRDADMDEAVPVWAKSGAYTLKAEDCKGVYRTNIDFDASTPEAQANRALAGQKLRQGNSISEYEELLTWQNVKDPIPEMARKRAESLMSHPAIQREAATQAFLEIKGMQSAMVIEQEMMEGEAGAQRKAQSSDIPQGGQRENPIPGSVVRQAISRKAQAQGRQ